MPANGKERSLIVIQLIGANDPLNTVIPYSNGLYYDYRPNQCGLPPELCIGWPEF